MIATLTRPSFASAHAHRRQEQRLNRMKYPEKAAALAAELANQIRTEQQKADGGPENAQQADEAEATLDSVELIEQMMLGVTENAIAMLGAVRCTLWLVNPQHQTMWSFLADTDGTGATLTGEDAKDAAAAARVLHIEVGTGLAGTCAATGEVIEVPDAWQDARFDKSHDEKTGFRTKTVACVPILKAPKRRTRAQRKMDRLGGGSSFKEAHAKEVGVHYQANSRLRGHRVWCPCLADCTMIQYRLK